MCEVEQCQAPFKQKSFLTGLEKINSLTIKYNLNVSILIIAFIILIL